MEHQIIVVEVCNSNNNSKSEVKDPAKNDMAMSQQTEQIFIFSFLGV